MRFSVTVALVLFLSVAFITPSPAQAGFLSSFMKQLDELNKNMGKVGDNLSANYQQGGLAGAFQGAMADLGAANAANEEYRLATIAAFKETLKKIVCFIPNLLKKAWDAFVDFLAKIRDFFLGTCGQSDPQARDTQARVTALRQPLAATGDHFLVHYKADKDFEKKLDHFTKQQKALAEITEKIQSEKLFKNQRKAIAEKLSAVQDETATMEQELAESIEKSLEGDSCELGQLVEKLEKTTPAERQALRGLQSKASQMVRARELAGTALHQELISRLRKVGP